MRRTIVVAGLVALILSGALMFGACSKHEEPPPAPMTHAEIMAVVESARMASAVINTSEAAARNGFASWEARIQHYNERVCEVDKVFDREGAERVLRERPHRDIEAELRKVLHRVELARLERDYFVATGEWLQAVDRVKHQRERPDLWTRLKALDDVLIERNRKTKRELNILQTSMKPDEERNLKRARGLEGLILSNIDERTAALHEIAPLVKEEGFVAQGAVEVTAHRLWKDFDDNEIAALQKYRGRRVKLSGEVARVTADFRDQPMVHLRTKSRDETVTVSGVPESEAAKLKKGDDITVICGSVSKATGTLVCYLE